jgi:hypothetical protein
MRARSVAAKTRRALRLGLSQQNFDEQRFDRFEEPPPADGDRDVVRMIIPREETECHGLSGRTIQFAAGKHSGGVTMDQTSSQRRMVMGVQTRPAVLKEGGT